MSADGQVPAGIDASVATAARMYDYYLGGHNNFAADRIAALKAAGHTPEIPLVARANRAFLGRAVRFLAAEGGIRQFLDLGTGLPTRGNVHEIAQAAAPAARVVYVDNDPMVLVHSRALKTGENTAVIHADLRDVAAILRHPGTQRLIDFGQPLAILFCSVLHFVPDPDAGLAVAGFTSVAAPGSYLVVSHAHTDLDPERAAAGAAVYARTANPGVLRTRQDVSGFFGGTDLLEPGLVPVQQWRPDDAGGPGTDQAWLIGGIGRLPAGHDQVPVTAIRARAAQPPPAESTGPAAAAAGPPADREPPPGIDASVATAARMYDYWLGGHHNFAADRIAAQKLAEQVPDVPLIARENRAFMQRAVRFLAAGAGIRQFLDLGTGLPATGSVHEVAGAVAPTPRVVYVDSDPMVLAHARALKTGANATVIQADLRDADTVLNDPGTRRLIDFSQPLAILFVSVLHFIPDRAQAGAAVARYLDAAAPGSYLVLSHVTSEPDPDTAAVGEAVYAATANPSTTRSRADILAFFRGLELAAPGLVPLRQWRPDRPEPPGQREDWMLGGVARKPA